MSKLVDMFKETEEPEEVKPKGSKISEEKLTGDININFDKIAKKAYFQRFIENLFKDIMPEQFKGIDFHTSREVAVKRFDNKINEINEVCHIAEKLQRDKTGDYLGVMKEFKEKLAKQKELIKN